MRDAYPDCANGRFVSIADFETPDQVSLFQTVGPSRSLSELRQPSLSILRSRNETGAGSLKAWFTHPDDRLICDGRHSEKLALIRDWRPYSLLLMSLHAPADGALIEITVQSGTAQPITWSRTRALQPGWNLIRLDTATIGETVDLADIRILSWRVIDAPRTIDLYLDDVILTDNTDLVLGHPETPNELYVFRRGRRILVGVRNRFELAFANGQIVAWRGPLGENLADPGGLGPWPVPLPADWRHTPTAPVAYDDPQLMASWGVNVVTTELLEEANALRAIVSGTWAFVGADSDIDEPRKPGPERPGFHWRYVIHRSGQIHSRVRAHAAESGWPAPRVGFALGLDGRRSFTHVSPPPPTTSQEPAAFALAARTRRTAADLLWSWIPAGQFNAQRVLASVDERRLALLVGDLEPTPVVDTVHVLRIWPVDLDTALEATTLVNDLQRPSPPIPTAGRCLTDEPGDIDHDGYNESEGCYELALDAGVLRFEFQPGATTRFDPVFRIHGTADRRCWTYVQGRLVETVARDAHNNLLLQLPHVVTAPTAVEVHTTPVHP
jgi:hypothetical protein